MNKFILVIAVLITTPVAAHNGATGIVKERMDGMVLLGKAMKELTALSRENSIDQAAVAAQAEIIADHSGDRMLEQFPTDSLQKASEARPSIWQNWEKFASLAHELETLAASLPAQKSPVLLQNALTLTTQTCASCHKDFRLKK